ncbi:hypothetical protein [Phytohabitans rumicis]|uniref:Uncharacterized protein n=1 Tax=Phytohabitans rumicis TaxID=1076125 RepID=A0A6V8LKF2_9ACTN|nr:hypothetical protein [Phytohabitans rumicis]GFJ95358.1 hypothetical protein Prum_090000 [Phytohabitans rumicis]
MTGTPLMFPVGHYLGPDGGTSGRLAGAHRVRAGGQVRTLPGGDPYTLWLLAHGVAGGPQPWTPAHAFAAAEWLSTDRFHRAVEDLARRGLLLVIDPDSAEAAAMARSYRWHSMLHGHGMRLEWSGRYGIGGAEGPWLLVDNLAHDIWRWAPITPTLWDACEALAPSYRRPPNDDDPIVTGPDDLLPHLLRRLHPLACAHAGFLDEA